MSNADYLLALRLQEEFNNEAAEHIVNQATKRKRNDVIDDDDDNGPNLNATQHIVHPEWETLDPTPDVYSLFGAFDIKFFQGKLKCVELEWSKKMYTCAGICYQRKNRMGMSITIRLSEPLLKLRSRRDLIQTLLHEMIHAYLFILGIRESNGGHGPNFCKMMNNINKVAGTNITVYHTFHDEVNAYKVHVWRCNGICQHRKPFYGWVRRTCNRAPGPNDLWWSRHAESCGGTFVKVSGPEPKRATKKAKAEKNQPKINTFIGTGKPSGGGLRTNGGGTQVITGRKGQTNTPTVIASSPDANAVKKPLSSTAGNLANVVGLKDVNDEGGNAKKPTPTPNFTGNGRALGGSSGNNSTSGQSPLQNVRDRWANKFNSPKTPPSTDTNANIPENKSPVDSPKDTFQSTSHWECIDDDIAIQEVTHEIIDISDGEDFEFIPPKTEDSKPMDTPKQSPRERQNSIRQELKDEDDDDDDVIELIDDEFDDDLHNKSLELLTDTSVIDDIFGADTLIDDFNNINNVIMKDPENKGNPNKEIISCPICHEKMSRDLLTDHLDGCGGIVVEIKFRGKGSQTNSLPFYKKKPPAPRVKAEKVDAKSRKQQQLLAAGYSTNDIQRLLMENQEEEEYNRRILNEMADERQEKASGRTRRIAHATTANATTTNATTSNTNNSNIIAALEDQHPCPICSTMVSAIDINSHLDVCLLNAAN